MAESVRLATVYAAPAAAVPASNAASEWRCGRCRTVLARVAAAAGSTIEIKCLRCKTLNYLQVG